MQEKVIVLATYSTISDAYIFKNILDMEGIESHVADNNASFIPSFPDIHEGGVRLFVHERDAARAISILNKVKETQEANPQENQQDTGQTRI